jgi:energy-coupling factor transporter ATP-binding protein EcfA2
MVQWWLFAAQDIEFRGSVALTGPNGSGKSSLLDALNTVLTAAHGRHLELNARVQTDRGGSRRTLRDYVLGALDDGEAGHTVLRDQALSYLLVGFERTDGSRRATVGICLSARADEPDEEIVARFVVDGRILRCADVADVGEDADGVWAEPIPWAKLSERLRASGGLDTEAGPEVFLRKVCMTLAPDRGTIDPAKFLRNLKNCIAFRPVSSTTEFVRNFLLDAQKLNLTGLRDSISRFRDIRAKIEELKKRISEADELGERAERVTARRRTLAGHQLALVQGRLHIAASELAEASALQAETVSALAQLSSELPGLREAEAMKESRLGELVRLAANDETQRAAAEAERAAELGDQVAARLRAELGPVSRLAADIGAAAKLAGRFDRGLAEEMSRYGRRGMTDPADRAVRLPGSALARRIADALVLVDGEAARTADEIVRVGAEVEAARGNLARARSGKREIGQATRALVEALSARRVEGVPLCDLVDAIDEDWRDVIEAILGDSREAVLVAPGDHAVALATYRATELFGAHLVNTTKSDATRPARPGTLAGLVSTKDRHARAFLDFRLGGIRMALSEADLQREDSAATTDLMYASGRTVRRLRRVRPVLGMSGEQVQARLAGDADRNARFLDEYRLDLAELRSAQRSLSELVARIGELDRTCVERALEELASAEASAARSRIDAARLREEGGSDVEERLAAARQATLSARRRREDAENELSRLDERLKQRTDRTAVCAEAEAVARREASERLAACAGLLGEEELAEAARRMSADVPEPPDLRSVHADPEARQAGGRPFEAGLEAQLRHVEYNLVAYHARRLANDRINFLVSVGDYVGRHALPRPDFLDGEDADEERFDGASEWLALESVTLRKQALVGYESEAEGAHRDAVAHFKGDFVGRMRGAHEEMAARLRDLNRQLAKRDFHGLTYRFDRKPSAAHKDMLDLIERASCGELGLDLVPAAGASDPAARALRRLEELAMDPEADLSEIEDPRRYFEFDIGMDRDGTERTTMSKRLGTGSGGQVQVPYYVAICAALASTYYPDRSGDDGGMALAIFDEAFNRMDTAVIAETIGFMRDVGLQPIIAAPDKERPTFMQFVDTLVGISRVGAAVTVDVQHVSPLAHAMFRDQNPALVGFDAYGTRLAAD